jgi:hypothetical protein
MVPRMGGTMRHQDVQEVTGLNVDIANDSGH